MAEPAAAALHKAFEEFLAREALSGWTSEAFAKAFEEEVSRSLGLLLSNHGTGFALLMSAGQGTVSKEFRSELETRLARNFSDDIARSPIGRAPDPLIMRIVAANLLEGLVRIVRESPRKPQLQERVRQLLRYHIAEIPGSDEMTFFYLNIEHMFAI